MDGCTTESPDERAAVQRYTQVVMLMNELFEFNTK